MKMPTFKVQFEDGSKNKFKIEICTPNVMRLAFTCLRNQHSVFRPWPLGGDWRAIDLGYIKYTSGTVWYRRSASDFLSGGDEASVRHLDVYLFTDDDGDEGTFGIYCKLYYAMNGNDSPVGDGMLQAAWALKAQPGSLDWNKYP
jgi:hypothetical protein